MRYHPDKNAGDEGAKARFQTISEAYSLLSNPEKRRFYDETGERDDVEVSSEDVIAQFREMMVEMMDGDSIMEMVAGMSPAEIAAMPPFPFPKVAIRLTQGLVALAHRPSAAQPIARISILHMLPAHTRR